MQFARTAQTLLPSNLLFHNNMYFSQAYAPIVMMGCSPQILTEMMIYFTILESDKKGQFVCNFSLI